MMSTTATINSRAPVRPSAKSIPGLPAASRLLPRLPTEAGETDHPPIYMKLNSSILSLLADGSAAPKITLEVSEKSKTLRIGNYEYQGSLYKEPGYLEVYLPENVQATTRAAPAEPQFRSCGQIRNRMTIKQDKPIKVAQDAGPVDLSQPTEQRIVQLLMLGPAQPQDLASKAQASLELVNAVLAEAAEPRMKGSPLYVLKKELKPRTEAREESDSLVESKRRSQTPPQPQRQDEAAARPERVTKTLKELREARATKPPGSSTGAATPGASPPALPASLSEPPPTSRKGLDAARNKAGSPLDPSASKEHPNMAAKRRAPTSSLTKSKRPRSEAAADGMPTRSKQTDGAEEDMFEIARKFKSAYGEYLELYSVLSKRKARPASQVEKLMAMHRQLERWKTTLWTNARNKRMVN